VGNQYKITLECAHFPKLLQNIGSLGLEKSSVKTSTSLTLPLPYYPSPLHKVKSKENQS
jgi:hypothetical protein